MKSIDYPKLGPILVKALQDQQAQIEELKTLVKDQQHQIRTLEARIALPQPANDNAPAEQTSLTTQ